MGQDAAIAMSPNGTLRTMLSLVFTAFVMVVTLLLIHYFSCVRS